MTLASIIARFARLDVVVFGDAMLDSYVEGGVARFCREAPVPVVAVERRRDVAGAAANTATAVAALGARTRFLSAVGNDPAGDRLAKDLGDKGIDLGALLRLPGRTTIIKQRISARGQLMLRLDSGSDNALEPLNERRMIDALAAAWQRADAIIVSDYGAGLCTAAVIAAITQLQQRHPRMLVVDARDLARWRQAGVTGVKPNYEEACRLTGLPQVSGTAERVAQITAARAQLMAQTGAETIAVTLDTAGALLFEREHEPYRTFTTPMPDNHAAGAGDTFTAALALALAAGAHGANAADLASAAATVCVATSGTTTCSAAMLAAQVAGENKVAGPAQLTGQLTAWRAAGKRIVFTNGHFDILHHGHITYLNRAKALGDVLIVGLNSDASVRLSKGPNRPINGEADRAGVLSALGCVDLVVPFAEATSARLVEAIRPDLFVKGGDYTLATLPEAGLVQALGGEVKILDFLDDRSTSGIIDRIRRSYGTLEATG